MHRRYGKETDGEKIHKRGIERRYTRKREGWKEGTNEKDGEKIQKRKI